MKKTTIRRLFLLTIGFVLFPLCAGAQDYRARITGTVADSTGAIVPDASVEIISKTTGLRFTATTNAAGVYLIQFLEPGVYKLTVFQKRFPHLCRRGHQVGNQSIDGA
jgi:hypothetical protein